MRVNISRTKNIRFALLGNLRLALAFLLAIASFELTAQTIIEQKDTNKSEERVPKSYNFNQFSIDQMHPDTFVMTKMDSTFNPFFNYDNHLSNFNTNLAIKY